MLKTGNLSNLPKPKQLQQLKNNITPSPHNSNFFHTNHLKSNNLSDTYKSLETKKNTQKPYFTTKTNGSIAEFPQMIRHTKTFFDNPSKISSLIPTQSTNTKKTEKRKPSVFAMFQNPSLWFSHTFLSPMTHLSHIFAPRPTTASKALVRHHSTYERKDEPRKTLKGNELGSLVKSYLSQTQNKQFIPDSIARYRQAIADATLNALQHSDVNKDLPSNALELINEAFAITNKSRQYPPVDEKGLISFAEYFRFKGISVRNIVLRIRTEMKIREQFTREIIAEAIEKEHEEQQENRGLYGKIKEFNKKYPGPQAHDLFGNKLEKIVFNEEDIIRDVITRLSIAHAWNITKALYTGHMNYLKEDEIFHYIRPALSLLRNEKFYLPTDHYGYHHRATDLPNLATEAIFISYLIKEWMTPTSLNHGIPLVWTASKEADPYDKLPEVDLRKVTTDAQLQNLLANSPAIKLAVDAITDSRKATRELAVTQARIILKDPNGLRASDLSSEKKHELEEARKKTQQEHPNLYANQEKKSFVALTQQSSHEYNPIEKK